MFDQSWLRGRTVVYNPAPKTLPPTPEKKPFCLFRLVKTILGFFWRVFKRLSLFIGGIIVFCMLLGLISAATSHKSTTPALPKQMILSFNLDGTLPETNSMSQTLSLLQMEDTPMTLEDMVNTLDVASKDDRVKALVVKASSTGYDLTQLQQLRAAVIKFKASGKKTAIFSESYGDSGYGLGLYYLATAFDQIWMQPVGVVAIGGVDMETPFFKKIMDEYGVQGQFFQRKEYKNAMEHLKADHMSPASREMMVSLVNDLAAQLVEPIKKSRPQVSANFDKLLNLGLLTDRRSLKEGLVDRLDYEDVLADELRSQYQGAGLVPVEDYTAIINRKRTESALLSSSNHAPTIAIIPVEGMIVSGSAGASPYGFQNNMAGADDIVSAIEDAANDKSVKAIVLRVNSPGGSPSASETIHRAVIWAKAKKKKPVIVSMGSLAASGGYWISAPADRIYALDSTLTGSIGVVGGKINLDGLWKKFNINWESIKYGENSGMMSLNTPFSTSEQRQFEETLDNVYDYFIKHVSEGRHLKAENVEKMARGRAYTGRQALALGLVDEIGGMDKVLDDLAKKNGAATREDLNLVYLPMNDDPMQLFIQLLTRKIGVSPFLEKMTAQLAPVLMMSESKGARLVYDRNAIQ
jgi:protease-4